MEIRGQIAKEWIEELKQVGLGSLLPRGCCVPGSMLAGSPGPRNVRSGRAPHSALSPHRCANGSTSLQQVDEENALLMRETMTSALRLGAIPVVDPSPLLRC